MTPNRSILLSAILVALSSSMTGCGGGGGGSNVKETPPPTQVVPPTGETVVTPNPVNPPTQDPVSTPIEESKPEPTPDPITPPVEEVPPAPEPTPDPITPPVEEVPPAPEPTPDPITPPSDEVTPAPEPTPDPITPPSEEVTPAPEPTPDPIVPPAPEPTPDPVTPTPVDPKTPKPAPRAVYRSHLDYTRVSEAQAMGYTGEGVKVGILDSGVNLNHPALQGKVVAEMTTATGANTVVSDPFGHGTNVAQIIAGDPTANFQGGVARNVDLYITRSLNDNRNMEGTTEAMDWMTANGVKIVNNSWNVPVSFASNQTIPLDEFMMASYRFISSGGLVVFATGNEKNAEPAYYSIAPKTFPSLEKGWLAVAALTDGAEGPENTLAYYSNACGAARNWCLAAPGTTKVLRPSSMDGAASYSDSTAYGTSFAAPQVSAAAALVWEAYPWMTNDQVRKTLLGTATDIGAPGVDEVFGYGLLNAGKAVNGYGLLNWGNETFNVTHGNYAFDNSMTGTGGFIKSGNGILTLTNHSTYTGLTTVRQGTLNIAGSVAGDVSTLSLGTLQLTGRVGGNLTNEGRTASMGGQVRGNWTQGSTSTLEAVLGAPSMVGGRFEANGTLSVVGLASADYVVQKTETVLTAAEVAGTFAHTEFASGLFMTGTTRYTTNSVELDVVQTAPTSLAFMMATPQSAANAQQLERAFAVGERLQAANMPVMGTPQGAFLAGLAQVQRVTDEADALAVANAVAGQGRALATSALLATQQTQDAAAFNRIGAASLSDAGAFASAGRTNLHLTPEGWASTRLQSDEANGGIDWDVGPARLGVVGQSSKGDLTMDGDMGHYRLSSNSLGLYGRYTFNDGWAVLGQVRAGRGKLKGERALALGQGVGTIENHQRFEQQAVAVRVEKAFEAHAGQSLVYVGGALYSHTQKASEDRGSTGFEQGTAGKTFASTGLNIGAQFTATAQALSNGWALSWRTGAELSHRHDRDQQRLETYYLVAPDAVGNMEGVAMGQTTWRGFADATLRKGKAATFLRADLSEGDDVRSWGLEAGLRLGW
jgi:hypothetical protein